MLCLQTSLYGFSINETVQILLSELLQVPTTIETNSSELHGNFYDSDGRSDASSETYPYHSLRMSKDVKDCRRVRIGGDSASNYVSCAHVMPMVNSVGQSDNINMLRDEGVIDQCESKVNCFYLDLFNLT